MRKKQTNVNFITAEHFAKTYLEAAAILLKQHRQDSEKPGNDLSPTFGLLLIPILYCIRHSIELFLKRLDIGASRSYLLTHDIDKLRQQLESAGFFSSSSSSHSDGTFLKVIKKYETYDFDPALVLGAEVDSDNEIFRFPEDKKGKMRIIGQNLPLTDLGVIDQDIRKLRQYFTQYSIHSQLEKNKYVKPYNDSA